MDPPLNVTGEAGRKIDIKYICESAMGANSYTMRGSGPESYARFTWFVFREAEISNWPGELRPEHLRAEAVYTDVETTGRFETSNSLFNTINKIWWRSQTDNMHGGIASDCPHRERSPYTGDGQVACVTVMHNLDAGHSIPNGSETFTVHRILKTDMSQTERHGSPAAEEESAGVQQ